MVRPGIILGGELLIRSGLAQDEGLPLDFVDELGKGDMILG